MIVVRFVRPSLAARIRQVLKASIPSVPGGQGLGVARYSPNNYIICTDTLMGKAAVPGSAASRPYTFFLCPPPVRVPGQLRTLDVYTCNSSETKNPMS
jgi:hypothetical protein